MIPNDTVQKILGSADIVEVVGEFVELKKRGANMIACCPFHNEKSPSFSVSPAKGIYKCFGCGKGGDSLSFVMELEGLTYPDALRWLAKKYGIEVKEQELTVEQIQQQNAKESLFIVLEYAQKYFNDTLLTTDEGKSVALSYFNERGFGPLEIEKFSLGYSLDSYDDFNKKALKEGFSEEILISAGLVSKRDNGGLVDRFRGRVIFPIHNSVGKPIAFGARILKPDPKAAKYINSPETEIYHKSDIVYGIAQAKAEIRNQQNCFLVEGYTDVVSLHKAGIYNVVASSGTSLTENQVRLIKRYSPNITVLYDGDWAGIKASLRGIDIILEEDLDVRVVVFPDGDDPDSYIKKVGGEAFRQYVADSQQDFVKFKTKISLEDVGDDPIKRAGLLGDLVDTIIKIPNSLKRTVYYQEVSSLLGIDEGTLIAEGNRKAKSQNKQKSQPENNSGGGIEPLLATIGPAPDEFILETKDLIKYRDEEIVKHLLLYGSTVLGEDEDGQLITYADYIMAEMAEIVITEPISAKIFSLFKKLFNEGDPYTLSLYTSSEDAEIRNKVVDWNSPQHSLSYKWKDYGIFINSTENLIKDQHEVFMTRLIYDYVIFEIEEIINKLDTTSDEETDILLDKILKKEKMKRSLAAILGQIL